MSSFSQQRRVVLLHLSFWCVYLSFFLYQITSFHGREIDWNRVAIAGSVQITFAALAAYLNYFILLPRFLKHKNLLRYIAEFILPFALLMIVRISLDRFLIDGFT